jgi:lipoprotein-anchoring transpeptidase ErfK/SrfK
MGASAAASRAGDPKPQSPGSAAPAQPSPGEGGDSWVTVTNTPPAAASHGGVAPSPPSTAGSGTDALAVPAHSGSGKRIVYDISAQRVWLVSRSGDVARSYLVSGGRNPHLLRPGRYAVRSMSAHAVSYDGKETMNYMVTFATGKRWPIGFHDIPARHDGTLVESRSSLGTPQSAGCIRQWITDAKALWEFASVGMPVVVTA